MSQDIKDQEITRLKQEVEMLDLKVLGYIKEQKRLLDKLDLYKAEIKAAESKQGSYRWVSLSEGYPKSGFSYIATDGTSVYQMQYGHDGKWHSYKGEDGRETITMNVTHWMSLPPAPTEEASKPLSEEK